MKYRFYTCDVFTHDRFGGNQLAVLPQAEGLSDRQMQQIAREFNFSETSFVLPPKSGPMRRVRIFTPAAELPFAGHPNVGTAFVLATTGELGNLSPVSSVTFDELAGLVPISIHATGGRVTSCELKAPQPVSMGQQVSEQLMARALSLDPADICLHAHKPVVVSVGMPFLFVELANRSALERATANLNVFSALEAELKDGVRAAVYFYTQSKDEFDIRARMFAPSSGVPEDPATGSATCAVAGLLAHLDSKPAGEFTYRLAQGVEMGRPSALKARALKENGIVTSTWVGGACVMVTDGWIEVD